MTAIRNELANATEQTVLALKELETRIGVLKNDLAWLCQGIGHPEAARVAASPVPNVLSQAGIGSAFAPGLQAGYAIGQGFQPIQPFQAGAVQPMAASIPQAFGAVAIHPAAAASLAAQQAQALAQGYSGIPAYPIAAPGLAGAAYGAPAFGAFGTPVTAPFAQAFASPITQAFAAPFATPFASPFANSFATPFASAGIPSMARAQPSFAYDVSLAYR
jgi:hypothetical protein